MRQSLPSKQQDLIRLLKSAEEGEGPVKMKSELFGFSFQQDGDQTKLYANYKIKREKTSDWIELLMDLSSPRQKVVGSRSIAEFAGL